MADEPKPPVPPSAPPPFLTSAICPNDLGLKAGFWSRKPDEPVRFREIVGWVTIVNFVEAKMNTFVPIVLSDLAFPCFCFEANFPDFIGVFGKALTPEEARAKARWLSPPSEPGSGGPRGQSQMN